MQPVLKHRNLRQIQNKTYNNRQQGKLSKDAHYNLLLLAHELEGFIGHISIYPSLTAYVALPEMMKHVEIILQLDLTDQPFFFRDREKAIINAVSFVLPNVKLLFCWNHLKRDFKHWLRTHGASNDELRVYLNDIDSLLQSDNLDEFDEKWHDVTSKWSEAAIVYVSKNLKSDMTLHAAKWLIKPYNIFNPISGITNNASESMNAVLHRLVQWKEVPVDTMALCLYHLQNYYLNEVLRGLCDLGNYTLNSKFRHLKQDIDDVEFPTKLCDPNSIVDHVRDTISDFLVGVERQTDNVDLHPVDKSETTRPLTDTQTQQTHPC